MVSKLLAFCRWPGGLLHQFVGNVVARKFMPHDQAQAVVGSQVALVDARKNRRVVPVFV